MGSADIFLIWILRISLGDFFVSRNWVSLLFAHRAGLTTLGQRQEEDAAVPGVCDYSEVIRVFFSRFGFASPPSSDLDFPMFLIQIFMMIFCTYMVFLDSDPMVIEINGRHFDQDLIDRTLQIPC